MEFNWYCDEYGLDTISLGVTMAFFMECFQRGYLTEEDIGYQIPWGDVSGVERLFHDSERRHLLQKMVNLRQGKGTRENDQILLRAMAPAFLNKYEVRSDYYSGWIAQYLDGGCEMPASIEEKHRVLSI